MISFASVGFAQLSIDNYSKVNALTSNEIITTFIDSKGILWVGTTKGLNAFTGSKWYSISHIETKSGKTKSLGKVIVIYEDRNGFIWTSTNKGLFLYNHEYWIEFINDENDDYFVKEFFEDSKGRLWTALEYTQDLKKDMGVVLINGTVHMYDGNSWFEYDVDVAGTARLLNVGESDRYFTGFIEDHEGNIWVSSLEGLYRYDGEEWVEFEKEDIAAERVYAMMIGNNEELWIATEKGVSRYESGKWKNYDRSDNLGVNHVLQRDFFGRIWAYTYKGYSYTGLNMFDGNKWHIFTDMEINLKASVDQVFFNDSLLLAVSAKGVSGFKNDKWFSYPELKESKYQLAFKDQFGTIWLADEKTLYQLNDEKWNPIFTPRNKLDVQMIFVDRTNSCWIGTKKNGVYTQNKNNEWVQYSKKNGLADNQIFNIFEDARGNIWIITDEGISKLSDN